MFAVLQPAADPATSYSSTPGFHKSRHALAASSPFSCMTHTVSVMLVSTGSHSKALIT